MFNNREDINNNSEALATDNSYNGIELPAGPRVKSEATYDFEKLIHYFLQGKPYNCTYNSLGELLIETPDTIFNLSQILKHQPDFEQIEIDDELLENYATFLKSQAKYTPSLEEKSKVFPSEEDYEKKDPHHKHANLNYSEKLAITLYASNLYHVINKFLRELGNASDSTKDLTNIELNLRIKELVLITGIAAHALAKVPTVRSENTKLERHERSRHMGEVLKTREQDYTEKKITLQEGFTSTTGYNPEEKKFHLGGGLTSPDVKTTIIQSVNEDGTYNPLGKDITELSPYDEKETLFIPNTQFIYTKMEQNKYGDKHFEATPVRSIDQIDPFSYTTNLDFIRTMLISIKEDNAKNKFSISKNLNNLFKSSSSLLINNQLQNKTVDTMIDKINNQQQISLNELNQLKDSFQQALNNRKYNFKLKNMDKKSNMLRKAISTVDVLIVNKTKQEINDDLLRHANYVYDKILSQPYNDIDRYPGDARLKIGVNNKVIERPNHGLAHTLRVTSYLPSVINYFKQFAKDKNFQMFCDNFSADEFRLLQLAMLFSVSGRESDVGFSEDKQKYREYRIKCAEQYKEYAKQIGIPEEQIHKYAELIENMGNPEYFDKISKENSEKSHLFLLMNLSHKLDLMRCYTKPAYEKAVTLGSKPHVKESPEQVKALNQLYQLAHNSIESCGDRMYVTYEDGQLRGRLNPRGYVEDKFIANSTLPEICLQTCEAAANATFNGTYELPFKINGSTTIDTQTKQGDVLDNSHKNQNINNNNYTETQQFSDTTRSLTTKAIVEIYEPIARDIFKDIFVDLGIFTHLKGKDLSLTEVKIDEDNLNLSISIPLPDGKPLIVGSVIPAAKLQLVVLQYITTQPNDYLPMALEYLQSQKPDDIDIPQLKALDNNYQIQGLIPITSDQQHFKLIAEPIHVESKSASPVEIIVPAEKVISWINAQKELNNHPTLRM